MLRTDSLRKGLAPFRVQVQRLAGANHRHRTHFHLLSAFESGMSPLLSSPLFKEMRLANVEICNFASGGKTAGIQIIRYVTISKKDSLLLVRKVRRTLPCVHG